MNLKIIQDNRKHPNWEKIVRKEKKKKPVPKICGIIPSGLIYS